VSDIYDLVRRSDGETIYSFPAGGRWQLYTANGIVSARPLADDEIIMTPASMVQLLRRIGYCVSSSPEE
jgi:hypothetical protein